MTLQIPTVDVAALFGPAGADRAAVDRAITEAAFEVGFMTVCGHPPQMRVGRAERDILLKLLDALARGLGIPESIFRDAFDDGISTLRLLHYPKRADGQAAPQDVPERFTEVDGRRVEQVARAHVDSGLLERWSGGRIKATSHRVIGLGEKRYSVPFFFEPRPSTVIAPLPIAGIKPFAPFLYGDHLWATTTRFPENYGLAHLRAARAPYVDPLTT